MISQLVLPCLEARIQSSGLFCLASEECPKTNVCSKYRRNSLSPFRSHLSQHVVPFSSFCDRVECKEVTLISEQSEHYSWSCGFLTWLSLGTMILLVAGGLLFIIRCCLKFRFVLDNFYQNAAKVCSHSLFV